MFFGCNLFFSLVRLMLSRLIRDPGGQRLHFTRHASQVTPRHLDIDPGPHFRWRSPLHMIMGPIMVGPGAYVS